MEREQFLMKCSWEEIITISVVKFLYLDHILDCQKVVLETSSSEKVISYQDTGVEMKAEIILAWQMYFLLE